jgi:putative ABC transport system permease protein
MMLLKQLNNFNNNGQLFFLIKPFDYFFLDEYFNRQYQKEQQLQKVFGYLSAIGLGIACLGLFGFTYFMTYQRTKEIGIRKTLGATMLNIIKLLSTEFAIVHCC